MLIFHMIMLFHMASHIFHKMLHMIYHCAIQRYEMDEIHMITYYLYNHM